MAKYNVNYQGTRIESRTMIGIADIIANWDSEKPKDVREVYKNMTGRYPTARRMGMV